MEGIQAYLLRIVAAAIICGILRDFFRNSASISKVIRYITGIFMILIIISPLTGRYSYNWNRYCEQILRDGFAQSDTGVQDAITEQRQIIKEKLEAYILNKAASLGAEPAIQIQLSEKAPYIPETVIIKGVFSPFTKRELCNFITDQLGIPGENQIWEQ